LLLRSPTLLNSLWQIEISSCFPEVSRDAFTFWHLINLFCRVFSPQWLRGSYSNVFKSRWNQTILGCFYLVGQTVVDVIWVEFPTGKKESRLKSGVFEDEGKKKGRNNFDGTSSASRPNGRSTYIHHDWSFWSLNHRRSIFSSLKISIFFSCLTWGNRKFDEH